jgi:predicted phage tail protein
MLELIKKFNVEENIKFPPFDYFNQLANEMSKDPRVNVLKNGKSIKGKDLVAFAIVFAPAAAGFLGAGMAAGGSAFTLGAAASVAIGSLGASLLLGGVAQLLTPVPKVPQGAGSDNDPRKTFNFSGIQQTSRQGVPVPCVYGKTLVGSVVISAGTDTVQVQA